MMMKVVKMKKTRAVVKTMARTDIEYNIVGEDEDGNDGGYGGSEKVKIIKKFVNTRNNKILMKTIH